MEGMRLRKFEQGKRRNNVSLSLFSQVPSSLSFPVPTIIASNSSLCSLSCIYHRKRNHGAASTWIIIGFQLSSSLNMIPSVSNSHGGEAGNTEEDGDERETDAEEIESSDVSSSSSSPKRWHVLGLGQAMVDFSGVMDDESIKQLGIEKGVRKMVNHEERGQILQAMDGCSYKAAAGGSLSNTLMALARLGSGSIDGPTLNIAMAGSIGSDALGSFYRHKLRGANVSFLSSPLKEGTTGTVIVLTTPDAQRTMLAYQGISSAVNYDYNMASMISKTSIFVVEGYLFEVPDTIRTITKACEEARRGGALVAVTASDVSCIHTHYHDFWEIVGNYADIVFANSNEARAFCDLSQEESAISTTRYLSNFVPFVSVTDGHNGSYIGVKGEAIYIPPSPCVPIDSCGAGDAYASGILYGILRGNSNLKDMGGLAAKIAAAVVGQQGTRLRLDEAGELVRSYALHMNGSGGSSSGFGSDQIANF